MTDSTGVAVRDESALPYLLFDRADDEAVVAKLKGQIIEAYVYSFVGQDNKTVYGLGVDGAQACKRELAVRGEVIEEEEVHLERDDPDAGYFTARASRWIVNKDGLRIKLDSAIGTKRQAKFTKYGNANEFWFEQGCAKAMRNAILRLTPEEIKAKVIELYKANAKMVKPPQEDAPPVSGDGIRVPFGKYKGTLVSALTDPDEVRSMGQYVAKSVEDPTKAKYKAQNERLLQALRDRYLELTPVQPAEGEQGELPH